MTETDYRAVQALTVVVPAYNEEGAVINTVSELKRHLGDAGLDYRIIVVDDCSTDRTSALLSEVIDNQTSVIRHGRNRGYGASLKTGIRAAETPLVVITDADGTYPNHRIPELALRLGNRDMIVGSRTGQTVKIPLIRRPAKWLIGALANYLTRTRIPDINSGLRVFRREVLMNYLSILPDGFSFTTTITLAMLTCGHEFEYVPINYAARIGKSKIRPIRDTLNFIQLIIRTVLLFAPLKIFLPLASLLFFSSIGVFIYSVFWLPRVLDTTVMLLIVGALQILSIGLIADMVNRRLSR